jgi:CDP-diacylglycerol--glycerol-3-phosphate 3-phosphatidyltransferase/cardiolipin synthase
VHVTALAKWKTAAQMVALALLIAGAAGDRLLPGVTTAGIGLLWLAAVLTLWTGYDYLKAGVRHAMEG